MSRCPTLSCPTDPRLAGRPTHLADRSGTHQKSQMSVWKLLQVLKATAEVGADGIAGRWR